MRTGLYRGVGGRLAAALALISALGSCRPTELAAPRSAPLTAVPASAPPAPLPVAADGPLLTEIRWLAPGADLVTELTTEPAECLAPPADDAQARAVAIGRAAFRAPGLLGGQAARAGLSCAACHRNGRDNLAFFFPGVSGEPGTADVTSSFFSSHRGDGVENPVPIPDLAGPRALLKVDRAPESRTLEVFIRGLIVEEFEGAEPPAAVLDGLAAYVRALTPEACPAEPRVAVGVEDRFADALAAAQAGAEASASGDFATADLLLGAARSALGRIDERYPGEENERVRRDLANVSSRFALLQSEVRAGRAVSLSLPSSPSSSPSLAVALEALADALTRDEARSLYAQDVLSRALAD